MFPWATKNIVAPASTAASTSPLSPSLLDLDANGFGIPLRELGM